MNTQTVTLDVSKQRDALPVVRIRQGDVNGTTVEAYMYDDGAELDLTGRTVKFVMRAPGGSGYYDVDGTASGNVATFLIDETYAGAVSGTTDNAYVQVLENGVVCSTGDLRVVVLRDATEGVDPSAMYDNGLNEAIERATQAAEAAEGAIINVIPTMSETIKGGAKVGAGLEVVSDTLSIDLTDEATGETITAADASYLASLTVDGKAVQDGTPTPSAPVDVQVVQGRNLLPNTATSQTINGVTFTVNADGSVHIKGTATARANFFLNGISRWAMANGEYVLSGTSSQNTNVSLEVSTSSGNYYSVNNSRHSVAVTLSNETILAYITVFSGYTADSVVYPQLEKGSTATPYTTYGSIGLKVGSTITPINLNGNVLASLPDGTKDVITVDSVGHCVLSKNVGVVDMGTCSWVKPASRSYFESYISDMKIAASGAAIANLKSTCFEADTADNVYNGRNDNTMAVATGGRHAWVLSSSYSDAATFKTAMSGVPLYYQLNTPTAIDLGYIDMPSIPDGSTISITAQVTPTISASWWARGAAAIAEALKSLRDGLLTRIEATETAIADL